MKRIKTLALACLMAVSASAQSEPGTFSLYPRLGLNISKFTNNAIFIADEGWIGNSYMKHRLKQGINAGAEFQYQVSDNFAVSAGAIYSMEGSNFSDVIYLKPDNTESYSYEDQKMQLHFINVPLLAVGYIGETGLAIKAGVQFGFLADATMSYTLTGTKRVGTEWEIIPEDTGKFTETANDQVNKLIISIPVGVSYEFSNVCIDARYNIGLSKLYKKEFFSNYNGSEKVRNSAFELTVGYKFEL